MSSLAKHRTKRLYGRPTVQPRNKPGNPIYRCESDWITNENTTVLRGKLVDDDQIDSQDKTEQIIWVSGRPKNSNLMPISSKPSGKLNLSEPIR